MYHAASLIVMPHGAGSANIIFARPGTPVIEVCYGSNQTAIRQQLDCSHMAIRWQSHGNHVAITWQSHGNPGTPVVEVCYDNDNTRDPHLPKNVTNVTFPKQFICPDM